MVVACASWAVSRTDSCALHTPPPIRFPQMAMEIAQAPAKGLLMQGFMMYMTGNSVSIISIMIVGMCLLNSTKALAAVSQRTCSENCLHDDDASDHSPEITASQFDTPPNKLNPIIYYLHLDTGNQQTNRQASRTWTTGARASSCPRPSTRR